MRPGREGLLRQPHHHRGVLADGIEHDRALELGRHLADDMDAFRLQRIQRGEVQFFQRRRRRAVPRPTHAIFPCGARGAILKVVFSHDLLPYPWKGTRMQRICFLLKVKPDKLDEYKRRHQAVWPEMRDALSRTGWHNYSLFPARRRPAGGLPGDRGFPGSGGRHG